MLDIDFRKDWIEYYRRKTKNKKSGESKTAFSIQPEAREIINKYMQKNGKETVVTVFFPFFTIISFSSFTQLLVFHTYKADICIRFATCQWELLTPTD